MTENEKLRNIIKSLNDKKAEDIQVIQIGDLTILADYFVIANGTSSTHTKTLADEVEYNMSQQGIEPKGKEGHGGSNWIILDYGDVVVHVFYKETRDYYQLENMWADGKKLDINQFTE